MKEPTKEQLQEARWLNCLVEDLPQARLRETFFSYWQRTNQDPNLPDTKLNYLIYKEELKLLQD